MDLSAGLTAETPPHAAAPGYGARDAAPLDAGAAPVTALGGSGAADPIRQQIDRVIAGIDGLLSEQVNRIVAHPRFRALEASWRSLARLVETARHSTWIRIRVLDLRWAELCRDLERAIEFDRSQLFRKIYEEEFGTAGGEPFGLLVGDYTVSHRRRPGRSGDDIAALQGMARIAAAAFAPFVVDAAPELLGLDGFAELSTPVNLAALLRDAEYDRWRSFQENDESRFLGIVLPHVLASAPYRDDGTRRDGFRFCDDRTEADELAWGGGAYAFAAVAMRAFIESGWFAAIRGGVVGSEEGGIVPDLDIPWFDTDQPEIATIFPGEVQIEDTQEAELGELGFIPVVRANGTSLAVFCGNASVQRPRAYDQALATVNARLSAMLQYILCISRFAHYLKCLGRDAIGSVATAEAIQRRLQQWITQYCNTNETAPLATLARRPLREARVEIREMADRPGAYYCVAHLQPHFQLDRVETSFRLVTDLTAPG
ncbi:MAG TPA: type VI secretion system contractile sheath large subunit [Stellaceae bacterium]|nr:type VI secretion system contractile sheath large subunit [Stellaceae bacterium]